MSSILEALRELEGGGAPTTHDAEPFIDQRGRGRWVAAGLVVVGLAGGVGGFLLFRKPGPAPAVSTAGSGAQAARAADALPPAAPAPFPTSLLDAEPPRAWIGARAPAAVAPDRPAVAVHPVKLRADAPRAESFDPGPLRTGGEPRVQVSAITYAPLANQRAAVLHINGGPPVTLHEGESANEVEVQLIMPSSVYVRHAGQIFAVPARD